MKKYIICLALGMALTSCYDLDREPEGVLSSSSPFTTTGEMSSYLDPVLPERGAHPGPPGPEAAPE